MMTNKNDWRALLRDAFGLLYASVWAWRGIMAAHLPQTPALVLVAVIDLALFAGFVRRDYVLRRPEIVHDAQLARRVRIARIIAIVVAVNLCRAQHREDLLLPIIGCIIGASYLPMARVLRDPVHLWVGGLVIAVALFSLPLAAHVTIAGLGTALIVWGGCAVRLWRAERLGVAVGARLVSA